MGRSYFRRGNYFDVFTCTLVMYSFLMYPIPSKAQDKPATLLQNPEGGVPKVIQTNGPGASEREIPINARWVDRAEFSGKGDKPDNTKNVLVDAQLKRIN